MKKIEITPRMATDLLAKMVRNRKISQITIDNYMEEMAGGQWYADELVPIVVDSKGRLLDGQHRLHAVIKLGRPVEFYLHVANAVIVDCASEQRTRSAADRLTIMDGVSNANDYAAILRMCALRIKSGAIAVTSNPSNVSTQRLRDIANDLSHNGIDVNSVVNTARDLYRLQPVIGRIASRTQIGYLLVDAGVRHYESMSDHVAGIVSDEAKRTPVQHAVRRRLLNPHKLKRQAAIYAIARSFNEPDLRRIEINSGTHVPDVADGYFETNFPETSMAREEVAA